MAIEIDFSENYINISVPSKIYSLEVLQKCFYWYGNEYIVDIDKENNARFIVQLESKSSRLDQLNKKELIAKIKNDINDHKTRDIVTKETQNIRDLLIAKAFSSTDEFDEDPPGEITDPVGFKL